MCVGVGVRACVRACVGACVCVCLRACVLNAKRVQTFQMSLFNCLIICKNRDFDDNES